MIMITFYLTYPHPTLPLFMPPKSLAPPPILKELTTIFNSNPQPSLSPPSPSKSSASPQIYNPLAISPQIHNHFHHLKSIPNKS